MSDSEEDFASADEGDVEINVSAGGTKVEVKERPSKKTTKTEGKETKSEQESEKSKPSSDTTAARGDSSSASKQKKSKGKGPEKGAAGSKDSENVMKKSEPVASSKGDEKTKPKSQAEKKGKQKSGKGKGKQNKRDVESKDVEKADDTSASVVKEETKSDKSEKPKNSEQVKSESSKSLTSDKEQKKDFKTDLVSEDTKSSESATESVKQPEEKTELKATTDKENDSEPKENLTLEQKANLLKSPSSQSITRPEPDHSAKEEAVLEKLAEAATEKKGGWGWGWGSSLLEVASSSVSTFTSQVGEGLHTVMETVESTLNVPDPEELAQQVAKQKDEDSKSEEDNDETTDCKPEASASSQDKTSTEADGQSAESKKPESQSENTEAEEAQSSKEEKTTDNQSGDGWFSAWGVSNITKMVESTGKTLVTGSLDVLETLGKKTFDVINDHDPGLKKARGFLHDRGDKPNLSATLRDAKEQYTAQMQHEKETEEARKAHFGSLFDDFQGLAHLEALEMLSNQSEKRVNVLLNALPPEAIAKLKPLLLEIKQNFEIEDDEEDEITEQEFSLLVTDLLKELNVGTTPVKILATRTKIGEKLTGCCNADKEPDVKEIHQVAISSLAELTSKCIEQFHKAGELILIQKSTVEDFKSSSNTLLRLTKVLTAKVGILSTKFSDCLNKHEGDEIKVSHLVTNIYLEASNSSTYIQDGFQLLLPVLQQAAIEKSQDPED